MKCKYCKSKKTHFLVNTTERYGDGISEVAAVAAVFLCEKCGRATLSHYYKKSKNKISVIIPTLNRKGMLYDLLSQLKNEKCEVIVVDDGSKDGTVGMIRDNFPKVKYVKGKGKGQGYAKQVGIEKSSGQIIGFLDDDVSIKRFYIKYIEKAFDSGQRVVQSKLIFKNKWEKNEKDDNPDTGKLKWNLFSKRKWNCGSKGKFIDSCAECGIFFRRDILRTVKFFDENLMGDAYGESINFSAQLKAINWKIYFEPNAVCYHLGAKKGGSADRYKKIRDNFCSKYTTVIVKNMMYLNRKYNKSNVFYVYIYFLLAGIYLSIRKGKNCLKYFMEGIK